MKRLDVITIAGDLASGKGTVSKILKEKLGYEIYSNGMYFRKLAKENNMSVTEFNEYVIKYPEIDKQIEKSAEGYAKEHENLIIDARLGWYVVPESFKVYLSVDLKEAAKRAFFDEERKHTENFETMEEHMADLKKRFELENERYFNLYGVRKNDMSNYNLVIDTTNMTPYKVAEEIIRKYNEWKSI